MQESAVDVVQVNEPGVDVTRYRVIADPPVTGAVQVTNAEPLPGVAPVITGEFGVVPGVPEIFADDALLPKPFTATKVTT